MKKQKGRLHYLPCALAAAYLLSLLIVLPGADAAGLGVSSDGGNSTSAVCPENRQASVGETASVVGTPVSAASSEAAQNSGSGRASASNNPASAASSESGQASGSGQTPSGSSPVSAGSSETAQSSCDSRTASGARPGYRYEDENVVVTAVPSDMSKMTEDALLRVTPVTEQSDGARFLKIENSVAESLQAGHRGMTGLRAYNITFTEKEKTIEPGAAAVTIWFKHGIFDGSVKKATKEIKVLGLKETAAETQVGGDVTGTAKLAAKAQSAASAADTVRFVTRGLSLFAVTGVGAVVETGTQFSADQIRSGLSPVLPYAVFANYFRLTADFEGCIAASSADIGANFGNSDHNIKYCRNSNTVTVKKIYTGSTEKTFRFGLYGENDSQIGGIQSITLPKGQNSGSTVFQADGGNVENMTVKELDSDGKPVTGDDPPDGFTLISSTHGKKQTGIRSMDCTSYIDSMKLVDREGKRDVSYQMNSTTLPDSPNRLVVGSGCQIDDSGKVICGKAFYNCYGSANLDQVASGREFPIDFQKTLDSLADFSAELAQASSSDTVMVQNVKAARLTGTDMNITNDKKMLLLNIDATDCDSVDFTAKLNVNNQSCSSWVASAANVVVNVYTKKDGDYKAYRGKIKGIGYAMGIFLAPWATITDTVTSYNGNIVADRIEYVPGEIHGVWGGFRGDNITWSFENKEYTPIVLPQTGGPGTSGFFAAGVCLLLLAAALVVFRRVFQMCRLSAAGGKLCLCGCRAPPFSGRKGVKVPQTCGSP